MKADTALITLAVLGGGAWLLWQTQGRGATTVSELVERTLDTLEAATSRSSAVPVSTPSPKGETSNGATTAPLPAEVLTAAINAPTTAGQIRPVANYSEGVVYQPVLTAAQEVVFAGSNGKSWVMRNGEWVQV